jgi:hypothetical protein
MAAVARSATLSVIDAILKNVYVMEQIANTVNKSTVLLSRLGTSESISGRKGILATQVGIHQGVGARGDNAPLPVAGWAEYINPEVTVKYLYGRFYVTGPAIAATRDNKGAFAELIKRSLKDTREGLRLDLQRQCWGPSTGILALAAEAAGDTTMLVDSPFGISRYNQSSQGEHPCKYIKRNTIVDVVDSAMSSEHDADVTVTAVSHSATATTLTQASNWTNTMADGDFVSRYNVGPTGGSQRQLEIMGLLGHVDDGTVLNSDFSITSYQGITRASYPEYQGNVTDNGGSDITKAVMRAQLDLCETEGDARPDLIITDYTQRSKYEQLLTPSKRFVNPMSLEGGFRALEFDGLPVVVDKDCPPEHWFFINSETLKWYQMSDWDWMDKDGSVLTKVSGYDAYEAVMYKYAELACEDPADNAVLYDCGV